MAKSFGRGRENTHAANRNTIPPKYKISLFEILHPAQKMSPQKNTHTVQLQTEFHSKTLKGPFLF